MNRNDIIKLGYGFAIGNNLDVNTFDGPKEKNINWETGWFNKPIDKTLISQIKDRGFKTIKIPISWSDHIEFDLDNNKCTCEKWWIDRCKDVIQLVIDSGLYCIINTQHDADWLRLYGSIINTDNDNLFIIKKYKLLWTMISKAFSEFDKDKLIFEDHNEVGDDTGTIFKLLSENFIDAVRSVDNNSDRLLIIDGNWSDSKSTYELENINFDDDNYIIGIHFYTPSSFTLQDSILDKRSAPEKIGFDEAPAIPSIVDGDFLGVHGNDDPYIDKYGGEVLVKKYDSNEVATALSYLNKIKEKFNIPVMITEFGCSTFYRDKDHVYDWFKQVTLYCQENKIPLVMWNNGNDYQCMKRSENLSDRLSVDMEKIITYYNHEIFGEDLLDEYKSDYPDIIKEKDYSVDPITLNKYGLVPKSALFGNTKVME